MNTKKLLTTDEKSSGRWSRNDLFKNRPVITK
jgi:hypothetical protein